MENPNLKWMMPGGILGNLYIGISHLINLVVSNMNGVSTILGMIGWNDLYFWRLKPPATDFTRNNDDFTMDMLGIWCF